MTRKLNSVQKITFAAMFLVFNIIAINISAYISIPGFSFVRPSLSPAIVMFSSLFLGPFYGALIGAGGDALAILMRAQVGSFNPLITVLYGLLGVLPWALEKLTKNFRTGLKKPYAFYVAAALLLSLLAVLFYGTTILDSSFGGAAFWAKPTILSLSIVLTIGCFVALYFLDRKYQKQILDYADLPSPNEVAFISLFSEIALMVLLKGLAFYVYFRFLSNNSFPLEYGFVASTLTMMAPFDILLNTFVVTFLLLLSKKLMRAYGVPSPIQDTVNEVKEVRKMKKNKEEEKLLEVDESKLSSEDRAELHTKPSIGWIIFFAFLVAAMVACVIVISILAK